MRIFKKKPLMLLVLALVALALFSYIGKLPLEVLSVDRIWLYERGVGEAGEELEGGWWRVLATTKSTADVRFIQLNHTKMEEEELYADDFPQDVVVQGEIYVSVWQSQEPYWVIPIKHIETITVTPRTVGTYYSHSGLEWGFVKDEREGAVVEPVVVSLWELDLAQKKVIVPFTVEALKTSGENVGPLQTDDERAQEVTAGKYNFEFSYSDISSGEMSTKIVFYSPNDATEAVKLNLIWTFGDYDRYSWTENFLFVTSETAGPISSINTFGVADLTAIRTELTAQSNDLWTFNNYWFGGPAASNAVFKGTTYTNTPGTTDPEEFRGYLELWDDGTPKPVVRYGLDIEEADYLCEGYGYGGVHNLFEYPGWYAPTSDNGEGIEVSEGWYYRYPTAPNIYSDRDNLKPKGLSICNYLASDTIAPVTEAAHIGFQRKTLDYWGYGFEGDIPDEYKVYMPTAARSWLFTLDVSTEIVDTVVVQQNYIDVELSDFTLDKTIVPAGEEATIVTELHNKSPFRGAVSVGITPPEDLIFTCTISGGDGSVTFEADETKTVTFTVLNKGLLTEDVSGAFTFKAINEEPRTTALREFELMFKAGAGVPKTKLHVTVLDADTNAPLSGILVQAWWGLDEQYYLSASTAEGLAIINMEYYEGIVRVSASDPSGKYLSQEQPSVSVSEGDNYLTFKLIEGTEPPDYSWLLWIFLAGFATVTVIVIIKKRRSIWT